MKNSTKGALNNTTTCRSRWSRSTRLSWATHCPISPTTPIRTFPPLSPFRTLSATPPAAALDKSYFAPKNIQALETREIEPSSATGREPHHKSWQARFATVPAPPAAEASPIVKMDYKLQNKICQAIYRLRKSTVEPVIGIIKETLGFR